MLLWLTSDTKNKPTQHPSLIRRCPVAAVEPSPVGGVHSQLSGANSLSSEKLPAGCWGRCAEQLQTTTTPPGWTGLQSSQAALPRWFRWLQQLRSKYLLSRMVRAEHKNILSHKIWIACSDFTGLCEISNRLMRNSLELVR